MSAIIRREWPHWAVLAAIWGASLVAMQYVTGPIPVHWNAQGQVDRYGDPFQALFMLPLVALGLYLLLVFIPRFDPARANYLSFSGSYALIRFATLMLLAVIQGVFIAGVFGIEMNVGLIIMAAIGLLFVVIGVAMGKLRPNYFAGVRTPWTLASAKSWTLTHRIGGRLFVAYGLLFVVMGVIQQVWFLFAILAFLFVSTGWLMYYSYRIWKADDERIPVTGTTPVKDAQ
jgi:uncharacterized membrane protein